MEADGGRQASRIPDSRGLNSTNQLHESSISDACLTSATCRLGTAEASSTFGGSRSASEAGEVLITPADQDNLVPSAVRPQDHGGTLQIRSHTRVPGHWWLEGVIYQDVEDEDYEDDSSDDSDNSDYEMNLDIDNTSHEELLEIGERIGMVNTGVREEAIMAQLKRRKYSCSKMSSPADAETCCICLEDYVDDEDVGKLDCGHEYHEACIKKWLSKKNSCPICKKIALTTRDGYPNPIRTQALVDSGLVLRDYH